MKFYVFDNPKIDSPDDQRGGMDAIKEEGFNVGDAPRCPKCGRPLGMLLWLPPYRLELETWGRDYGDVSRTGDNLVVSHRFVHMYQDAALKGLAHFEPVQVLRLIHRRGRPKEAPPSYFTATVPQSQTTVDQEASGYVWKDDSEWCRVCLRRRIIIRYERVIIKPETWAGEDIFFPRGGRMIVVSDRFREAFERHALRGAICIPAEDYGYDSYASPFSGK